MKMGFGRFGGNGGVDNTHKGLNKNGFQKNMGYTWYHQYMGVENGPGFGSTQSIGGALDTYESENENGFQ